MKRGNLTDRAWGSKLDYGTRRSIPANIPPPADPRRFAALPQQPLFVMPDGRQPVAKIPDFPYGTPFAYAAHYRHYGRSVFVAANTMGNIASISPAINQQPNRAANLVPLPSYSWGSHDNLDNGSN